MLWTKRKRDCRPVMYLTVREFAHRWEVTDRTVRRWVGQGLPTQDIGDDRWTVTMIPRSDGDAWVQGRSRRASRN